MSLAPHCLLEKVQPPWPGPSHLFSSAFLLSTVRPRWVLTPHPPALCSPTIVEGPSYAMPYGSSSSCEKH